MVSSTMGKSNEITAMPELLMLVGVHGGIAAMDAA